MQPSLCCIMPTQMLRAIKMFVGVDEGGRGAMTHKCGFGVDIYIYIPEKPLTKHKF